jgi:hypothetical protein
LNIVIISPNVVDHDSRRLARGNNADIEQGNAERQALI